MKLAIIFESKAIHIDGVGARLDPTLPPIDTIDPTLSSIYWDNTHGELIYNDGKENKKIDTIDPFLHIVAHHSKLVEKQLKTREDFEKTYVFKRNRAYPKVEEQLDMFYHAMDSGEMKKVPVFYNAIKGVKERFPKVP